MSKKDTVYSEGTDTFDTIIHDDSGGTYAYTGRAPRQEVIAAGSLAAAKALPIWFLERTTLAAPYTTEKASNAYDQVYDDAATITSWA